MAREKIDAAMRGKLDALRLLELLTAVRRQLWSGSLSLQSASQSVTIKLDCGSVRSVSINDRAFRIGQVLIQLGLITEEQIEQALALQSIATDPERIGEVLVDVGYISESDISQAVATQIASVFNIIFRDGDGEYSLDQEVEPSTIGPRPDVMHEPLILTALFLAEYWIENAPKRNESGSSDALANEDVVPGLSREQQEFVQRFSIAHRRVNEILPDPIRSRERVQKCIEHLIEHILLHMPESEDSSATEPDGEPKEAPAYRVSLVDREIDIWDLADLTRNARHLLLCLLNGEDRLSSLIAEQRALTDNPERAIRELTAAGLILVDTEEEGSDQEKGRSNRDGGTVILRFLP